MHQPNRLAGQIKTCACVHFHLPHHSAWPFKLYVITLYGFSRIHVWMWELDNKKGWRPKNWCTQTGAGEDSWEFLGQQGYQTINPKGNQSWIFIRRTDDEAEASILCPPDVKSWLIGKDSDAGKDWRQEEKGMTGDEMIGWHHWLNGYEFEQTQGDSEGQGSLVCCRSWGCKESDTT